VKKAFCALAILFLTGNLAAKIKVGAIVDPWSRDEATMIPLQPGGPGTDVVGLVDWSMWTLVQISGEWAIYACNSCEDDHGKNLRLGVERHGLGPLHEGQLLLASGKIYTDTDMRRESLVDSGDNVNSGQVVDERPRRQFELKYLGQARVQSVNGFELYMYKFQAIKSKLEDSGETSDGDLDSISASALLKEFNDDADGATKKYQGQHMVVTGRISAITPSPNDSEPTIFLTDHGQSTTDGLLVYFEMAHPNAVLKRFKIGMAVKIPSVIQGKTPDGVTYVDCEDLPTRK
jgi:hypothetical protein